MKPTHRIILTSFILGLALWVMDAVLDYLFFYSGQGFWDLLILQIPEHEIYIRLVIVAVLVGFGIVLSRIVSRLERLRKEAYEIRERLLTTLNSIGDGVVATDAVGRVTLLNPVAAELTGCSKEEAEGRSIQTVFNIVNEESGRDVENPVDRVIREGAIVGLANHTILISKDGTRRPIDDSGAPIRDPGGNPIGTVLVFHDITERRESEKRFAHLNSVLRAIRNVNQLITKEKDRSRLIQGVCDELTETRGYYGVWIGLRQASGGYQAFSSARLSEQIKPLAAKLQEGYWPSCCERALAQSGPVVISDPGAHCQDCPISPLPSDLGVYCAKLIHNDILYGFISIGLPGELVELADEVALFTEVADDISFALSNIESEENRAAAVEGRLAERERLQVTLESVGDAVIATDAKGRITIFNMVAERLTGWASLEAIGQPLDKVFHIVNEITRQPCENPVERVFESDRIVGLANHTLLIARDGTERAIADSGAPIRDKSGKVIGVVLVFRDITETRQLRKIADRARRLESAGEIAGQIAHDFNNLLGPLVAYPGLLREDLEGKGEAIALLDDMENAAQRISDINQQLLTLGRRGHYNQEPMDLNKIARQVIDNVRPTARSLTVRLDLAENLMNMRGGPAQILRVVANLVNNAIESMADTGKLTIRTENFYVDSTTGQYGRVPAGEYIKLTVCDSGTGIDQQILPRIFDPFFTTKTSDRIRGSGLGLSVVHGVVADHDGYIDVESSLGQGSSFYLYFPVCRDTIETPLPDEIVGGEEEILVVDDDSVQREVSSRLLKELGYQVRVVSSGEAAVQAIQDSPVDLVILDMIMPPGIDGAETYERILVINPSQKAIIVSGFAENERVQLARKMGAGEFVKKPLTLRLLAAAVRRELDRVPQP